MPKKPAKKKLGKTQLKRTRGGSQFDAFLVIDGIKGETEDRSRSTPTLGLPKWKP